ncbi:unnamed protein product [Dovyalis caffra]|uniref:Uncharacterized protein n=1 Tax=Dovyalis caffra TaxID=77055 RepID=A0AAV1RUM3_9ROSI|nr:unnamed protein product [Dovyalis caffra]
MSDREDSESDAPEEFTAEQGIQQDEEIRKVQKESKARVVREAKEKRRQLAQRKTPKPSKVNESVQDVVETENETETETEKEYLGTGGMLPSDIVQLLADREKKVFLSDSEDEKAEENRVRKRKKPRSSGKETVILKDMAPPRCLQNSLEFLNKKKMQLPRSSSVLNNPNQAFRLLTTSGLLINKLVLAYSIAAVSSETTTTITDFSPT